MHYAQKHNLSELVEAVTELIDGGFLITNRHTFEAIIRQSHTEELQLEPISEILYSLTNQQL